MKEIATLLTLFTLSSLNTFAQDYTQWGLPEGAKARLGKGWISGNIAYSPDGARLAVASNIGIWIYDMETYQVENSRNGEVALLTGHTGWVFSVAYSPDGSTLASGSGDGVRMWDTQTGAHIRTLGNIGGIYSIAFSPDGNTLASGGHEQVNLWDTQTGAHIHTLRGHRGAGQKRSVQSGRKHIGKWE